MTLLRRLPFLLAPLIAATAISAQTEPTTKPTKTELQQEITGSPAQQAQELDKLRAQLEQATEELRQLEQIQAQGGVVAIVRNKLGLRNHEARSFQPEKKMTGVVIPARAMTQKELAAVAPDTMFTVNAQPVSANEFQRLYDFMKGRVGNKDPEDIRRKVIDALALRAGCLVENPSAAGENRRKLEYAKTQYLEERRPFEELVAEMSQCPQTKETGGRLGVLEAGDRDVLLMSRAFDLEKTDVTIIESTLGYHLVECLEATDTTRELRHVFLEYCPEVAFVHKAVRSGFAEVVFRNHGDVPYSPGTKAPEKSEAELKKEKLKAEKLEAIKEQQKNKRQAAKQRKKKDGKAATEDGKTTEDGKN